MNRNCMNQNMTAAHPRMMHSYPCGSDSARDYVSSGRNESAGSYSGSCTPCTQERMQTDAPIPVGSKKQLLCYINEVSFAVYETLLYLDTHPDDQEAMCFFREHNQKRERALQEYARRFGPLTISTANDSAASTWEWMCQPWPWEGGDC